MNRIFLRIRPLALAVDREWNWIAQPRSTALLIAIANLSAALVISSCSASFTSLQSAATATNPLNVTSNSHVVVMEYEAWFGPNAMTFANFPAKPALQSPDMQALGGGYDSADPAVIKQHVSWLEAIGVDAALIEVTNNVSCIFNSQGFIDKYLPNCTPTFRSSNQTIRNNTGNLYPAWNSLGTNLKLIPMVGGVDNDVMYPDQDGTTALEKEIRYFGALLQSYPNLSVIYQGKPLMIVFLGAAQDPSTADNPLWYQIEMFLQSHPDIANKYTFRFMAGYLDSQPGLWQSTKTPTAPVQISPSYGFWSWVDRLNTGCAVSGCPFYPSYNQAGSRIENFTVSVATVGAEGGWGCPNPNSSPYCPDDSLRFGNNPNETYITFTSFMTYAKQLNPIFLIIHQFNEFTPPDEGFDANSTDDVEPANLWGTSALTNVQHQIQAYRQTVGP